jgi:hypothetical protein
MAFVSKIIESIQYDGTNSQAVVAFIDDSFKNWEVDGVLFFEAGGLEGSSIILNVGDHITRTVRNNGKWVMEGLYTHEIYVRTWIETS